MINTDLTAVELVSVETVDGALALFLGAELAKAHALKEQLVSMLEISVFYLVSG